ncbi:MAG: RES family NAD+ phosphorylase [Saprospiraceae bacterium]|nr:RES family NAD+ phosphorylase [Saprospiraceae bacterium]
MKLLTRSRRHQNSRTLYPNISDLWYPPEEYVDVSRGNIPNNPVFYCSNDPGTAIFEIRPELNDWITSIEVRINLPVLEMLVMGLGFEDLDLETGNYSYIDIGLNRFLKKKFKEEISYSQKHLYYKTALFVEAFIKNIHGIIYPSMASNLKGWNFVLEKEFADNYLIFNKATVLKVIEKTSKFDFKIKCIYNSTEINQFGDFIWERVNDCDGHHITESIYDKVL